MAASSRVAVRVLSASGGGRWRLDETAEPTLGEGGYGAEVRDALARRSEHLVEEGVAAGWEQVRYPRGMVATLREREVADLAGRLETQSGLPHQPSAQGEYVTGTYRQRFALASGRIAMIDDGLGLS
ncbi:DUF3363 domain-containing protein [Nguyenibacter vanlangensis]|uniref:DUF3363 domain-containing protein n=1 Tax=Nguyenibacter vanlangensis TaxID=1216886 RepID=A0ABZ3D9C8_9PROT